jgi:hypothetical protein
MMRTEAFQESILKHEGLGSKVQSGGASVTHGMLRVQFGIGQVESFRFRSADTDPEPRMIVILSRIVMESRRVT